MKIRALITGITGMDASYLAELLLNKGYEVFGLERRNSSKNRTNIEHIENKINFITGDLTDQTSLLNALRISKPDEVYNLAAQSFVQASFTMPIQTSDITGLGVLRLLEAIREYGKPIKFYQAGSSEMFGKVRSTPQNECTPFYPRSPYGVSKVFGHWITKNYREAYNMFNVNGILFNHESERRGIEFVTRKITNGVAKIHLGIEKYITLGNLDAERDWGHSEDYVRAMWLMLQQDKPSDYVISTGKKHSIREFLTLAFKEIKIDNWHEYVKQDKRFMRPSEVDMLVGNPKKATEKLNWRPTITLEQMIKRMVDNDIKLLKIKYNL